jgi:PPOX class probable FMN-dependent enzyme
MQSTDPHRISTVEQLRALVGEPHPLVPHKLWKTLEPAAAEFIRRAPFLLLATSDADGRIDVSPKGDGPGFVAIEDDRTLLIPDRKGNKLVFGLQNILVNPHVGVLFITPGTEETLRVNGAAEITADSAILDRLSARGQPAVVAIRVTIEECFFHCAKAFKRSQLWRPEAWPTRQPISFGKLLAPKVGGDDAMAQQIDLFVEQDYKTNL